MDKITQQQLTVSKTARYFLLGEPSAEIRHVWFVCHGYGQLASYFLKKFEPVAAADTLVVAPEGLHRFYTDGFSGRIGASWMTKEDRADDIHDYINMLESVSQNVLAAIPQPVKIHVLGFSQGAATVVRWLANSELVPDSLTLWCSFFPPDVDWLAERKNNKQPDTHIVLASDDVFIKPEEGEKQLQLLYQSGLRFTAHRFDGKHTVDAVMLKKLAAVLYEEPE